MNVPTTEKARCCVVEACTQEQIIPHAKVLPLMHLVGLEVVDIDTVPELFDYVYFH